MKRRNIWLYSLFQPYKWLVFGPLLVLSTALAGSFIILFGRWLPRFCNQRVAPGWCRFIAAIALSATQVNGRANLVPGQSYIVVANHQSHFDILALYGSLGLDLRWVMKQELRKIPVFGRAAEELGHIYVDRRNRQRAREQMAAARKGFRPGTSVLFFPEGTRSDNGELLPFKSGAFAMAKQLELPILPVALSGTRDIAPARSLDLFPGTAQMTVLEPIPSSEVCALDIEDLIERSRRQLESAIAVSA